MSYLKTLGWTLFGIFMLFGAIGAVVHLVRFVSKVLASLPFNPDTIIEFLNTLLGSDILVASFLALITMSPLIAYYLNE